MDVWISRIRHQIEMFFANPTLVLIVCAVGLFGILLRARGSGSSAGIWLICLILMVGIFWAVAQLSGLGLGVFGYGQ